MLWQQAVHNSLMNGPHVAFHTIGACTITMTVETPTVHQEEHEDAEVVVSDDDKIVMVSSVDKKKADSKEYHDVAISVTCRGIKWNKLSLDEEIFSAKALMDAYNLVHLSLDAGDWHLEHVAWENAVSMQNSGRLGAIGGS
jgi:hypothetical protein